MQLKSVPNKANGASYLNVKSQGKNSADYGSFTMVFLSVQT